VLDTPPELRSDVRQVLTKLVRHSLGPPERYLDSVDKARLVRLASEIGIAVPPGEAITDEREAMEVALALGFPVIVRPTVGTASEGVAVCTGVDAVRAAVAALPREDGALSLRSKPALVQRFLTGIQCNRAAFAWEGREVAGFTRIAQRRYPNALGPGSVACYRRVPAVADANRRLLERLGMTGFASTLYIVDPATGTPHLIEINRRMTPATHTGRLVGVDLAAAFAACAMGRTYTGPTDLPDGPEHVLALFPQEWLRDPYSDDLQRYPTDTPFDDPDLLRALIDLGTGRE
jgi:biotin carboxylase